jgi:hypothetical protein
MATVVNITKKSLQDLVDQKKSIKEIAEHFSAPVAQIKKGLDHFGIKIPRASKGGVVYNWVNDEEATFELSKTPVTETSHLFTTEEIEAIVDSQESVKAQEEVVLETADNTDF